MLPNGLLRVDYPRCPECQWSLVRCKRYSGSIKKIHQKLASTTQAIPSLPATRSKFQYYSITSTRAVLPGNIATIVDQHSSRKRLSNLTELFTHVIGLFTELDDLVESERTKLLNAIYASVEKNNSVFLTRQQWSDLEIEYNRLRCIALFRSSKESTEAGLNESELDTLDDILFGPNRFGHLACQVCHIILDGRDSDGDHWQSILPQERQWDDFEKDRLICDGRWFECQKSKFMEARIIRVRHTTEILTSE